MFSDPVNYILVVIGVLLALPMGFGSLVKALFWPVWIAFRVALLFP